MRVAWRATAVVAVVFLAGVALPVAVGARSASARTVSHRPSAQSVPTLACGKTLFPSAASGWWVIPGGGVDVYSNGTDEGRPDDCSSQISYVNGVRAGEEWQCVEFINRLYLTRGWITGPKGASKAAWPGSAGKAFYDNAPANLTKQPDGSVPYLGPGDVVIIDVVHNGQPDGGHALVVNDASDVTDGTVNLVSQNSGDRQRSQPAQQATISGGQVTVEGGTSAWSYTTVGVVHAPATWGKAIEVPGIAALDAGGSASVNSVSCASSGNCSAGGGYTTAKNEDAAFVVSDVNGTWGTAQKVHGAAAAGGITSVSCASPGNCSAGGYSGNQQAFVVSEVNGTWGTAIRVPGAAGPGISESWLLSVSCGSPGNCSAGGMYQTDDGSANEAFVVSQTSGTWGHLTEVPRTAALNTGADAEVNSLSCGSAGNCSAGGSYQDAAGTQAFVASETGGIWRKAVEVPGTAALNTSGYAVVESVSCASAGNCSAGGLYSTGTSQEAFVVDQVNGAWGTASEVRGSLGGAVWLTSVSCGSPGNCSTGGYYAAADGTDAFVASETNGTWGTAANVPGTSGTGDEVDRISCGSAGNCSAGGGSTGDQTFVVNETDGTWGTATGIRGLGTRGSLLFSVSCPPAGNCAAGGEYTNSSDQTPAFVVSESGG